MVDLWPMFEGEVLSPEFEGERKLRCRTCKLVGLGSPIRERTNFYSDKAQGSGYRTQCKRCGIKAAEKWKADNRERSLKQRAKARERRKAQMSPEQLKEAQRKAHEDYLRTRNDPKVRARRLEYSRRYQHRHKERLREERRIDYRLKLEQKGEWKPPPGEFKSQRTKITLPIEPVANWIEEMVAIIRQRLLAAGEQPEKCDGQAAAEVAKKLGYYLRRIYSCRKKEYDIELSTLEVMITNHGEITIEEIYQNYGNGYSIYIASDWSCLRVDYWKSGELRIDYWSSNGCC